MPAWNHNIHYHPLVLQAVPPHCQRALDVGCGQGRLARQLANRCPEVVAIDADPETLRRARQAPGPRIAFLEGDALTYPFPDASFDLVTAVATLHHLPLRPALERFQALLKPNGVLAIVGLYRTQTPADYALAAAALPASRILRLVHHLAEVEAPLAEPKETLREIRAACHAILPGGTFRRHLLFRYSFLWRKP